MNIKFRRSLFLVGLVHVGAGFAFGCFPWLRPWSQLIGLAYILVKALFIDPLRWCGKTLWELDPDDGPYRWGRSYHQVVSQREKGSIDMACHMTGQIIGMIVYEFLAR